MARPPAPVVLWNLYRIKNKCFFMGQTFYPKDTRTGQQGIARFPEDVEFDEASVNYFELIGPEGEPAPVPTRDKGINLPPKLERSPDGSPILAGGADQRSEEYFRNHDKPLASVPDRPSSGDIDLPPPGANSSPQDPDAPGGENYHAPTALTDAQMLAALKAKGYSIAAPGAPPEAPAPATVPKEGFAKGPAERKPRGPNKPKAPAGF